MHVLASILVCLLNHDCGNMEDACLYFFKTNYVWVDIKDVLKHKK